MASIITDAGLEWFATSWEDSASLPGSGVPDIVECRFGEGGYEVIDGVPVPRTPDPTLTNLDCVENPTRYAPNSRYVYAIAPLPPGSVTRAGSVVTVVCELALGDANNDGFGNSPEFWEACLFNSEGVMVAYRTFQGQTKDAGTVIRHTWTLTIQRP